MTTRHSLPRRFFGATYTAVDVARRIILNVIFILLVILIVSLIVRGEPPIHVGDGIAVMFDPVGAVVEEYDASPVDRAVNRLLGMDTPQVRLRDLRGALLMAATDPRVEVLALDLSRLQPVSLSKLQELAEPLALARMGGKRVMVYSDAYEQSHYFLAAHADEIAVNPMGAVFIEGYSSYRLYMREAIERLSIDWHVFKAGDFKSYGEPYERDDMSPQVREETAEWLGSMWRMYEESVEGARGFEQGTVSAYVENMVDGVRAAGGDMSAYAAAAGFVDQRIHFDEFVALVRERVGAGDGGTDFHGLGWEDYYVSGQRDRAPALPRDDRVAVLIANGPIVDGDVGQEVVGAERVARMLEDARADDAVRALVLRIDSPGGSAFASEKIRSEIDRFRAAGKPVVVSMSSVAASGGYWIAMSADEVWASPATVTGSIGVIGMFPTVDRGLARLGLRSDGVGTTPMAGAIRIDRPLTPEIETLAQLLVDGIYTDFVGLVADARGMETDAVDAIADGRVWSGLDAQRIGLVDSLGGMDDAIAAAAALADLPEFSVQVLERELSFRERLLLSFLESRSLAPLGAAFARTQQRPVMRALARIEQELGLAAAFSDRRGAYLYCFCEAP